MLCYIRANDQKSIRGKLIALYALNVSDALLTYWLIGTGYFSEVNFLLKGVVLNFGELFLIKIAFPAALIAWLYFRIHSATEEKDDDLLAAIDGARQMLARTTDTNPISGMYYYRFAEI